jgi:hypothetical protein
MSLSLFLFNSVSKSRNIISSKDFLFTICFFGIPPSLSLGLLLWHKQDQEHRLQKLEEIQKQTPGSCVKWQTAQTGNPNLPSFTYPFLVKDSVDSNEVSGFRP